MFLGFSHDRTRATRLQALHECGWFFSSSVMTELALRACKLILNSADFSHLQSWQNSRYALASFSWITLIFLAFSHYRTRATRLQACNECWYFILPQSWHDSRYALPSISWMTLIFLDFSQDRARATRLQAFHKCHYSILFSVMTELALRTCNPRKNNKVWVKLGPSFGARWSLAHTWAKFGLWDFAKLERNIL